ncbi:MAG: hypothetical protein [Bacteriophage sp.]|nr:MAG: hypothetical protein [Bacteriophage sp.]
MFYNISFFILKQLFEKKMSKLVYVVPTLDACTMLTDPTKIIAYTLAKYLTIPKSLSMPHYRNIISAADTISRNANSPDSLARQMQVELEDCFSRIFNDTMKPTVTVTIDNSPSDNKYTNMNVNIDVSLLSTSGEVYKVNKPFFIDQNNKIIIGTNPMDIDDKNQFDNFSLDN